MKISIWQEFSSNHSNSFTVVGEFNNADDAHKAYLEFHKIIREIADWYRRGENRALAENVWDTIEDLEPIPKEVEVFGRYNIQVSKLTSWLAQVSFHTPDWEYFFLRQLDQYVLLENPQETWAGAHPFDLLMQKFAVEMYTCEELSNEPVIMSHITAVASDEGEASRLYRLIMDYKQLPFEERKLILSPWYAYVGGVYDPDTLPQRLTELLRWKNWKPDRLALQLETRKGKTPEERQSAQEQLELYDRLRETRQRMKSNSLIFIDATEQNGKTLQLSVKLGFWGLIFRTSTLISWLRGEGCEVNVRFAPEEPRSNKK